MTTHKIALVSLVMWLGCSVCPPPDAEPCPAPDGCARCAEAINLSRPPSELCDDPAGIPGGVPSAWIWGALDACVCAGDCSAACASACAPTFDQAAASPVCQVCITTVSTAGVQGCGRLWQVCSSDTP